MDRVIYSTGGLSTSKMLFFDVRKFPLSLSQETAFTFSDIVGIFLSQESLVLSSWTNLDSRSWYIRIWFADTPSFIWLWSVRLAEGKGTSLSWAVENPWLVWTFATSYVSAPYFVCSVLSECVLCGAFVSLGSMPIISSSETYSRRYGPWLVFPLITAIRFRTSSLLSNFPLDICHLADSGINLPS